MAALIYLVDTLTKLYLLVLLLRLLLQWSRADFRNPISRAIVQITNPIIMPLRRVLPPIRRVDTASVVALAIGALLQFAVVYALATSALPPPLLWVQAAALALLRLTLYTYLVSIFLYAVLSMIAQGSRSPAQELLATLCEPVLRPFRRTIPPIANIDLSPLWAGIAIQAVLLLLP